MNFFANLDIVNDDLTFNIFSNTNIKDIVEIVIFEVGKNKYELTTNQISKNTIIATIPYELLEKVLVSEGYLEAKLLVSVIIRGDRISIPVLNNTSLQEFSRNEYIIDISGNKTNIFRLDLRLIQEEKTEEKEKLDKIISAKVISLRKSSGSNFIRFTKNKVEDCIENNFEYFNYVIKDNSDNSFKHDDSRENIDIDEMDIRHIIFINRKSKEERYCKCTYNSEEKTYEILLDNIEGLDSGTWNIYYELTYKNLKIVKRFRCEENIKEKIKLLSFDGRIMEGIVYKTKDNFVNIHLKSDKYDILFDNIVIYTSLEKLSIDMVINEDYIKEREYQILLINRSIGTEIYIDTCNKKNSIEATLKANEIDKQIVSGIWDFWLEIRKDNFKYRKKVFTEIPIFSNVKNIIGENVFSKYRIYTTSNKELSIRIYEEKIDISIDKILIKKEGIEIYFKIDDNELKDIVTLRNAMLKVPSTTMSERIRAIKYEEEYILKIQKEDVINLGECECFIEIELQIQDVVKRIPLKYTTDLKINKETYMRYPEWIIDEKNGFKIKPMYKNQTLLIDIKSSQEFILDSIKEYKDKTKIIINDIGLEYDTINLVLVNLENDIQQKIRNIKRVEDKLVALIEKNEIVLGNRYKIYISYTKNRLEVLKPLIVEGDKNKKEIKYKKGTFRFGIINYEKKQIVYKQEEILSRSKTNKMNKNIACIISKLHSSKTPIWLIGENLGMLAQDNGYSFFEYCMKQKIKEKVYYVIRKENYIPEKLDQYKDNVIFYDSLRHNTMYKQAQYLVVSHGIRDVMPTNMHSKIRENEKEIIYLQHGIIAMKKIFFNSNSYNSKIKKFVVSSEQEKGILIDQMGFNPEQVMITGLSRFDNLVNRVKDNKKQIFIMPTWREWTLNNEESFLSSNFYRSYKGLLTNSKLLNYINDKDIVIKFYPHIEIQKKYMNYFKSDNKNIEIINVKEDIQTLVKESNLFITDYSSVALDFNYLSKPVIFYQFDIDEYLYNRGSFVDLAIDLPGDVVRYEDELIQKIIDCVENDYRYKDTYKNISERYYSYRDTNNNKRIYEEIKKIK